MTKADFLVVGAGIVGVSIARALKARFAGASVIVTGSTAGMIKGTTERFSQGVGPTITSWQLWATFAAGVVSLYLLQRALQAGSLAVVQPESNNSAHATAVALRSPSGVNLAHSG